MRIMASASLGANINARDYNTTIIISVIAVIGFVIGITYRDKIIKKLSNENY